MAIQTHTGRQVIVVGRGTAGIGAAIASARRGAQTLLIESGGHLGGELVTGLSILTFHAASGEQHIWGLPQELVERAVAIGGSPGHLDVHGGHVPTITYIEPECFKVLANRMVQESGAQLLFHSVVTDALVEDGRLRGLEVHNKSGRQVYTADVVIDATGDGDVAAHAGAAYDLGRPADGLQMAMTLMFRLGGVDLARIPASLDDGRTYGVKPGDTQRSFVRVQGLLRPWAAQIEAENLFTDGGNHLIALSTLWPDAVNVNTLRLLRLDGTSAADLSKTEVEAREHLRRIAEFLKRNVHGFETSYLIRAASRQA
ncbi:MAG: FAD-dependent oxidoreductase [Actinobacteria bacterium]|nr:FAD-dependent oxidoreductase [Actinomycetota bacterium]